MGDLIILCAGRKDGGFGVGRLGKLGLFLTLLGLTLHNITIVRFPSCFSCQNHFTVLFTLLILAGDSFSSALDKTQ